VSDYTEISPTGLKTYRYINGSHQLSQQLVNSDRGDCENDEWVYINQTSWASQPSVNVQSKNINFYNASFPAQDQSVIISYTDLEEYETGHWRFKPVIQLVYGDAMFTTSDVFDLEIPYQPDWTYYTSDTMTIRDNTEKIVMSFSMNGDVNCEVYGYVYIDDVLEHTYYLKDQEDTKTYSLTVDLDESTSHTLYVKAMRDNDGTGFQSGNFAMTQIDEYVSTSTVLSEGTGTWEATEII
jgi:hypothetical protein